MKIEYSTEAEIQKKKIGLSNLISKLTKFDNNYDLK